MRARIHGRAIYLARAFHLRGRQTIGTIGALAQDRGRIELATSGIFQYAVLHAVVRIAGLENRSLDHRKLGRGDETGWVLVDGLRDPHDLHGAPGIDGRRARDHAVKISRVSLHVFESLPAAGGTTVPIRIFRVPRVIFRNHGLGLHRHFVHRAIPEVDHLLRVSQRVPAVVPLAFVAGIGGSHGVPLREGQAHLVVINLAGLSAISDSHELAIPRRRWRQPDFDLDFGVAGWSHGCRHAAKCREALICDVARLKFQRERRGRRKSARRDRGRHRDQSLRQGKFGKIATSGCGDRTIGKEKR